MNPDIFTSSRACLGELGNNVGMVRVGNFWGDLNDWLHHTHIVTQSGLGFGDNDDVLMGELLT